MFLEQICLDFSCFVVVVLIICLFFVCFLFCLFVVFVVCFLLRCIFQNDEAFSVNIRFLCSFRSSFLLFFFLFFLRLS